MRTLAQTEKELENEKKRLRLAGTEVLEWLESSKPLKIAAENPWVLAGVAAGLGFFFGQWMGSRNRFLD